MGQLDTLHDHHLSRTESAEGKFKWRAGSSVVQETGSAKLTSNSYNLGMNKLLLC